MNQFKRSPWYKRIYAKYKLRILQLRYPENVWYGGSLNRETALSSVGKGWSKIINNLYDAKPKRTNVQQVKEKFGTLRFYVSYSPAWYDDLIQFYEYKSGKVCLKCGKEGSVRGDLGWMLTLCDEHYMEQKGGLK